MRVLVLALMLAFAGVGLVALAEPAAAYPPCDLNVQRPPECCVWYDPEHGTIWWEEC